MSEMKRRGRPPRETNTEAIEGVNPEGVVFGDVELQQVTGLETGGQPSPELVVERPEPTVAKKTTTEKATDINKLGVYAKVGAVMPKKATLEAAGMDVCAFLEEGKTLKAYNSNNTAFEIHVKQDADGKLFALIPPKVRVMVPTGLFLSIPEGKKVNVYPRSGLSLKHGVSLINCTGVIDADYTDELCVLLVNHSDLRYQVMDGERVAQIALEEVLPVELAVLKSKPRKRADRTGGFGSTGKQ